MAAGSVNASLAFVKSLYTDPFRWFVCIILLFYCCSFMHGCICHFRLDSSFLGAITYNAPGSIGYDSSLRGHARMKLQTCRNDLSYINAPYCAQHLPRFFIFIEKIHFKIKPSPYYFDRILANVNTPAKNINVIFW